MNQLKKHKDYSSLQVEIYNIGNSIYLLLEKDMSISKRFKRKFLKTLIISKKDCNIIVKKNQLNSR